MVDDPARWLIAEGAVSCPNTIKDSRPAADSLLAAWVPMTILAHATRILIYSSGG